MPDPVAARIGRADLPPELQAAWDAMQGIAGESLSIEVMAANPAALGWYNEQFYGRLFNNAGGDMTLDPRTKELLRLRLSKGHGCHVCNSHNEITAREMGFTTVQIEGIVDAAAGLFDERDRAVIDLAAEMELANMAGHLSADLHARLRRHYSDAQIVEMGMIAAFLTGMAKFLFVYDLVTREAACPIARPVEAVAAE